MKSKFLTALFIILLAFVIGGCHTIPESIPEDLAPIEYFQKGQEATNSKNWEAALLYYRTFIERYPDDSQRIVEAEFEIGNIYYKQGEYKIAEDMFSAILEKYSQPGADILPAWPKILSEKQLATVMEKQKDVVEE